MERATRASMGVAPKLGVRWGVAVRVYEVRRLRPGVSLQILDVRPNVQHARRKCKSVPNSRSKVRRRTHHVGEKWYLRGEEVAGRGEEIAGRGGPLHRRGPAGDFGCASPGRAWSRGLRAWWRGPPRVGPWALNVATSAGDVVTVRRQVVEEQSSGA